jgi:hypothetical protein
VRAGVTDKSLSLKSPASPTGIAKQSPCYNVASRKRRRFLNRWIKSLATEAGRIKIKNELRRRIRHNKYWVNEANKYGIETLCELMLAIFDDLDLRDWQTRHNLETLAERAGLATRSDAVISRFLVPAGDVIAWSGLMPLSQKKPLQSL